MILLNYVSVSRLTLFAGETYEDVEFAIVQLLIAKYSLLRQCQYR